MCLSKTKIVIINKHFSVVEEKQGDTTKEARKFVNCVLKSKDGMRFDVHEKLINQTQLMQNLFEDAKDSDCCNVIKIVFACPVSLI